MEAGFDETDAPELQSVAEGTPEERALEIFRRVPPLIQGTGHNDAPAVLAATEQFIANQEAIIRAGSR